MDYRNANDRFHIYMRSTLVCARRLDSRRGWGMRLRIKCTKPKIKVKEPFENFKVNVGKSRANKRCVNSGSAKVKCHVDAGNKHKRVNRDYWNANDRFHVTIPAPGSSTVCARRLDSKGGWGMNLQIRCRRPVWKVHNVYIGNSRSNKRCVDSGRYGIKCKLDAGNRYKRVNRDYWNANDRFHIRTSGRTVCATRKDSRGGWGMRLHIKCKSPARPVPVPRPRTPPRYLMNVGFGRSRSNTKCIKHGYFGVKCNSHAGNRGHRINRDYWNANDRFHIYTVSNLHACARRLDSRGGWGMGLVVRCTRPRMRWKNINIGSSRSRTKCAHVRGGRHQLYCRSDGGNKYIRKNRDYWHANDRFYVYTPGHRHRVCARRDDRHHGWGMRLTVQCQEIF